MDTVVLVLMLLTAFNFLLKQTFWKLIAVGIITAICAVFAGLMWPYAIEQSKTQIANWLSNQLLMLDTSVLLSVEVCIQMAYAMLMKRAFMSITLLVLSLSMVMMLLMGVAAAA